MTDAGEGPAGYLVVVGLYPEPTFAADLIAKLGTPGAGATFERNGNQFRVLGMGEFRSLTIEAPSKVAASELVPAIETLCDENFPGVRRVVKTKAAELDHEY